MLNASYLMKKCENLDKNLEPRLFSHLFLSVFSLFCFLFLLLKWLSFFLFIRSLSGRVFFYCINHLFVRTHPGSRATNSFATNHHTKQLNRCCIEMLFT